MLELKANPTQLPKDAFSMVCKIYKKYLNPEVVCDEYLNFIQCFDVFLKTDELPKYLYSDNDIAKDSDSEFETENDDDDDDSYSLKNEIENHGSLLPVFRAFMRNGLHSLFPNIYIILKLGLTLPVGSVSTERSFSKLKPIKTRLRSTMGNDRLEGLMIMSCENDINIKHQL
ncbi:unnamed protein product [Macrosiphum euphorbiae]|uniref:HAT C-terminal dimerisation domain-containing protein n=1 Tax=Macrosiphum euphorbiae TaxID=13131 RepID=A0AAV0WS10_9HEMI|nr:unnamed protein product [Macrosiphum euphorbiae]